MPKLIPHELQKQNKNEAIKIDGPVLTFIGVDDRYHPVGYIFNFNDKKITITAAFKHISFEPGNYVYLCLDQCKIGDTPVEVFNIDIKHSLKGDVLFTITSLNYEKLKCLYSILCEMLDKY